MEISQNLQDRLTNLVEQKQDRLIAITQQLVRIPSENKPPAGAEERCQQWLAEQLAGCGLQPDLYELDQVADLRQHPLYYAGRQYQGRPNLGARYRGTGAGRSLLLSGHIDTVPSGTQAWTRSPFSGDVEGNRLYGRGSNDMKAGVASNLFVIECIREAGITLHGDLLFESVVDEEFGGCNGTLAGRVRGYNADAAILSEPSGLRICPAQRGGRTAHIVFRSAPAGVLQKGYFPTGAIPQLTHFLSSLRDFAKQRRSNAVKHEMYADNPDPVPVSITKVFTSPWGFGEPIGIPDVAQVEMYWQLMPGETQAAVDQEFFEWMERMQSQAPDLFSTKPEVSFPIRWLPGSAIRRSEPVIEELSACARAVLGSEPQIAGIEGPCDLFILQQGYGIPSVLWGPSGGKTHAADEYVEIDSLVAATKALLLFVVRWCGLASA